MLRYLTVILFIFLSLVTKGQITVADTMSATEMAQYLAGPGVLISNVTLNCPNGASGSFDGSNSNIGIDKGIILTSGSIQNVPGPNSNSGAGQDQYSPGDLDLDQIIFPYTTNDACVLTFDVTPIGDTIKFNYVFGSEEYPEFVNSYNDAFAFFIGGPGVGFQNIALIPGTTTPVTIDNVNNGTSNMGPCVNCQYYVNNGTGMNPGANSTVQYDGFTTVLTAEIAVIPCSTYQLKMVVADAVDYVYDSGVFLEQASISSNTFTTSAGAASQLIPFAIEGCLNGFIRFDKIKNFGAPLTIKFQVGGDATNGVDYAQIIDSIVIPPGDTTGLIPIIPLVDTSPDDSERVVIYLTEPCNNTIYDSVELFIRDKFEVDLMPDDTAFCSGDTIVIGGPPDTLSTYNWIPNQYIDCNTCSQVKIYPPANAVDTYKVEVNLAGNCLLKDSMAVYIQEPIADFDTEDPCIGTPNLFNDLSSINIGNIVSWAWDFNDGANSSIQNPTHTYLNIGAYNVSLSVIDDIGCTHDTIKAINIHDIPTSSFTYHPGSQIFINNNIQFNNNSNGGTQWLWLFGNGDSNQDESPVYAYSYPGIYNVSLITSNGYCHDTTYKEIEVKYDFMAEVPQAFTPNNDGHNDKFNFIAQGLVDFEFRIINRWGSTMYVTNDINDLGWDGLHKNEAQPAGIYVYYLTGKKASNMEVVILKGDLTLIR